jgi:uncharacterized membrane protein YiaA
MESMAPLSLSHRKGIMLQTLIALGLLLIGFIAADWIQLNGYGWVFGVIYLAVFTPLLIIELIRMARR